MRRPATKGKRDALNLVGIDGEGQLINEGQPSSTGTPTTPTSVLSTRREYFDLLSPRKDAIWLVSGLHGSVSRELGCEIGRQEAVLGWRCRTMLPAGQERPSEPPRTTDTVSQSYVWVYWPSVPSPATQQ